MLTGKVTEEMLRFTKSMTKDLMTDMTVIITGTYSKLILNYLLVLSSAGTLSHKEEPFQET